MKAKNHEVVQDLCCQAGGPSGSRELTREEVSALQGKMIGHRLRDGLYGKVVGSYEAVQHDRSVFGVTTLWNEPGLGRQFLDEKTLFYTDLTRKGGYKLLEGRAADEAERQWGVVEASCRGKITEANDLAYQAMAKQDAHDRATLDQQLARVVTPSSAKQPEVRHTAAKPATKNLDSGHSIGR